MRALLFSLLLLPGIFARAEIITKDIAYTAGDTQLRGFLAWDDTLTTSAPGVLVIHEWWGLNDYVKSRARQLAALGYVAFVGDMYGAGKVTSDPKQAGAWAGEVKKGNLLRPRARAALDLLAKQPHVDAHRLAAIGYCFGGSTVLELAYSGAPVKGVVSFHGSLSAPGADDPKPVPARLLILHGASDTFETEAHLAEVRAALTSNGADWQMHYYSQAVHAFTNPDAGSFGLPGVAYNHSADVRSWAAMRAFFDEIF